MNQTFKTIVYTTFINCFFWGVICSIIAQKSFDIGWEAAIIVMRDCMESRGHFQ